MGGVPPPGRGRFAYLELGKVTLEGQLIKAMGGFCRNFTAHHPKRHCPANLKGVLKDHWLSEAREAGAFRQVRPPPQWDRTPPPPASPPPPPTTARFARQPRPTWARFARRRGL